MSLVSPPPEADEEFESRFDNKPTHRKYGHTPPPVDTGVMGWSHCSSLLVLTSYVQLGQAYMHRGQLTPVSQPSDSRNTSPKYIDRRASPRRTDDPFSARQDMADGWQTPLSATQPGRPGGYGGFDEPNKEISDRPLGGGFLERVNTAVPGPFDPLRRPSTAKNSYPQRKDSLEKWIPPPDEPVLPKPPRKNGYEGFGAPKTSLNAPAALGRSETFPKPSPTTDHFQAQWSPPVPGSRPERSRTAAGYGHDRKKSLGPDVSRRPPPRTSLVPEHKLRNSGSVDLAAEFGIGNPYHTPTESTVSGYSDFSVESGTTAPTSPGYSPTYQEDRSRGRDETNWMEKTSKSKGLRIDPSAAATQRFAPQMVETPRGISPRDEQFDVAFSGSQRGPPSRGAYGSPPRQNGGYMRADPRSDFGRMGSASPSRQNPRERQGSRDPMSVPSRGDCKACGIAIRGKSISSADGRLTGKYHKACFVCTTCSEPFSSSVFYVLDDKPYCNQHYHKLNGSLCGSCGRGIEGQYAEDEMRVKYHVGCFRCLDCGVSLSDGYFEVDGYSYCERDAWKRVQPPPPPPQPEPETYRTGPPRGAFGARNPQGLPARPTPRFGQGGRPHPPPPNGVPNGGRLGVGVDQRLRMNKRMTRLGNMN